MSSERVEKGEIEGPTPVYRLKQVDDKTPPADVFPMDINDDVIGIAEEAGDALEMALFEDEPSLSIAHTYNPELRIFAFSIGEALYLLHVTDDRVRYRYLVYEEGYHDVIYTALESHSWALSWVRNKGRMQVLNAVVKATTDPRPRTGRKTPEAHRQT